MCGILLVKSQSSIPLEKHLDAFKILGSRGPDFDRYVYQDTIFCGQTVLHITGTNNYYNQSKKNFLAYNGEIYNYQDFGSFESDIDFVDYVVNNDINLLKQAWGPWAWAWVSNNDVFYATDPQGEKCLFQYQDADILIVCSEVAPILAYINATKVKLDAVYQQRHWCIVNDTPWHNIKRLSPGAMFVNGKYHSQIDSIFDWVKPGSYSSLDEVVEEFEPLWANTIKKMTPTCPTALTYSGGLDSSIILQYLESPELYTTNMPGKDPIVNDINEFLTVEEIGRLHLLTVNEEQWADAFNQVLQRTQMPVQSWSFVGQWLISKQCNQRVLFTGVAADELFGGYDAYQTLNYQTNMSASKYSCYGDFVLWNQCMSAYNNHAGQATLLMDYLYQVVSCDARGIDVVAGAWGIEPRNPFMAAPIVKFALSLPFEFKVGTKPKPVIRKIFTRRWDEQLIKPKKGFSGHCNDSLTWLDASVSVTGNRDLDWKNIVMQTFYNCPKVLTHQTTQV